LVLAELANEDPADDKFRAVFDPVARIVLVLLASRSGVPFLLQAGSKHNSDTGNSVRLLDQHLRACGAQSASANSCVGLPTTAYFLTFPDALTPNQLSLLLRAHVVSCDIADSFATGGAGAVIC
jgi:hypothetical protein